MWCVVVKGVVSIKKYLPFPLKAKWPMKFIIQESHKKVGKTFIPGKHRKNTHEMNRSNWKMARSSFLTSFCIENKWLFGPFSTTRKFTEISIYRCSKTFHTWNLCCFIAFPPGSNRPKHWKKRSNFLGHEPHNHPTTPLAKIFAACSDWKKILKPTESKTEIFEVWYTPENKYGTWNHPFVKENHLPNLHCCVPW